LTTTYIDYPLYRLPPVWCRYGPGCHLPSVRPCPSTQPIHQLQIVIDHPCLLQVRARLSLAERVDKAERTERKASAEHSWATRTAESVRCVGVCEWYVYYIVWYVY